MALERQSVDASAAYATAKGELAYCQSWLYQITGCQRGHASNPNLFQFRASQLAPRFTWLNRRLGRAVIIDDLADYHLSFIGGCFFFINGMRIALLGYQHNRDRTPRRIVPHVCPIYEIGDFREGRGVRKVLKRLAPRAGLEPATKRLTAARSTN